MRVLSTLLRLAPTAACALLLVGKVSLHAQTPAPEPSAVAVSSSVAPTGSIALWNGHDLTGWTFFAKEPGIDSAKAWSVHDGVLRLHKIDSLGYLRTDASYHDYHLHLEWRWPDGAGNSGVMLHQQLPDVIWPTSIEAQLKSLNAADLIAHGTFDYEGGVIDRAKRRQKKTGPLNEAPLGEWNTYDIYCRGDTIELFINGQPMNRAPKLNSTAGMIGLQTEGASIEFRNLWLLPLSVSK